MFIEDPDTLTAEKIFNLFDCMLQPDIPEQDKQIEHDLLNSLYRCYYLHYFSSEEIRNKMPICPVIGMNDAEITNMLIDDDSVTNEADGVFQHDEKGNIHRIIVNRSIYYNSERKGFKNHYYVWLRVAAVILHEMVHQFIYDTGLVIFEKDPHGILFDLSCEDSGLHNYEYPLAGERLLPKAEQVFIEWYENTFKEILTKGAVNNGR